MLTNSPAFRVREVLTSRIPGKPSQPLTLAVDRADLAALMDLATLLEDWLQFDTADSKLDQQNDWRLRQQAGTAYERVLDQLNVVMGK